MTERTKKVSDLPASLAWHYHTSSATKYQPSIFFCICTENHSLSALQNLSKWYRKSKRINQLCRSIASVSWAMNSLVPKRVHAVPRQHVHVAQKIMSWVQVTHVLHYQIQPPTCMCVSKNFVVQVACNVHGSTQHTARYGKSEVWVRKTDSIGGQLCTGLYGGSESQCVQCMHFGRHWKLCKSCRFVGWMWVL